MTIEHEKMVLDGLVFLVNSMAKYTVEYTLNEDGTYNLDGWALMVHLSISNHCTFEDAQRHLTRLAKLWLKREIDAEKM